MIRLTPEKLRNDGTSTSYGSLSIEQRLLLVNSGSMTYLLEELLNQELVLNKINEESVINDEFAATPYLRGHEVLKRTITLQGETTGVNHLYAESLILVNNLDKKFADLLLNSNIPIGRIWELLRIETYKILDIWGGEPANELGKFFGLSQDDTLLYRTYFVFTGQKLTMRITEKFPVSWYRNSLPMKKTYRTVA